MLSQQANKSLPRKDKQGLSNLANSLFYSLAKFLKTQPYVRLAECCKSMRNKIRSQPLDLKDCNLGRSTMIQFLTYTEHPNLRSISLFIDSSDDYTQIMSSLADIPTLEHIEIKTDWTSPPPNPFLPNPKSCTQLKELRLADQNESPDWLCQCSNLITLQIRVTEGNLFLDNLNIVNLIAEAKIGILADNLPNLETANLICNPFPYFSKSLKLRKLALFSTELQVIPNYSHLTCLTKLTLTLDTPTVCFDGIRDCISLTKLKLNLVKVLLDLTPLVRLISLTSLNISAVVIRNVDALIPCTKLRKLKLTHLEDYTPLSLLTSVVDLTLAVQNNRSLPILPPNLVKLTLNSSLKIKDITSISTLNNLEVFDSCLRGVTLGYTPLLTLSKLTVVKFNYDFDTSTPCLPVSVIKIQVESPLLSFGFMANCLLVKELNLSQNRASFEPLNKFVNLTELNVSGGGEDETINLNSCKNLTDLTLCNFSVTGAVHINSPKLKCLKLITFPNLFIIMGFNTCPNLETLTVSICPNFVSLYGIPTSVQKLNLTYCDKITEVEGLVFLTRLRELNLSGCTKIKDISSLSRCSNLELMFLSDIELDNLGSLALCPNLREIIMHNYIIDLTTESLRDKFKQYDAGLITKKYIGNGKNKNIIYNVIKGENVIKLCYNYFSSSRILF
jgi:hypothetical protein